METVIAIVSEGDNVGQATLVRHSVVCTKGRIVGRHVQASRSMSCTIVSLKEGLSFLTAVLSLASIVAPVGSTPHVACKVFLA